MSSWRDDKYFFHFLRVLIVMHSSRKQLTNGKLYTKHNGTVLFRDRGRGKLKTVMSLRQSIFIWFSFFSFFSFERSSLNYSTAHST